MQAIPTSADQAPASVSQLFSYPFRIFFLSMTVLTLVAIPVWVLEVTGVLQYHWPCLPCSGTNMKCCSVFCRRPLPAFC